MAKNLGKLLGKQLKKFSPIQVIVLVVVLVFVLYDTPLPSEVENIVREPFGKFILLVIVLGSFASFGVIVGMLVLLGAYEILRRSGETHEHRITNKLLNTPSKVYNENNSLSAMNQFPITLEEEVIHKMVPLVEGDLGPKSYKPTVSEIDGTTPL
tara:strand:+ start:3392 stop:3856 length:465 start_codon:yes stop_codon:yes gene_type:complete